jgi:hypothetical protein
VDGVDAAIMVFGTVSLLSLFVAASRGYRLPRALFRTGTWSRVMGWTAAAGAALTVVTGLVDGSLGGAFAIVTGFALLIELMLWAQAKTFGPRDG